ncbi:MAG: hypothetical protein IPP82_16865 [Xanthomonadales bacterium]|nr:hypothetical protein [Xanthomonadales bacterium]
MKAAAMLLECQSKSIVTEVTPTTLSAFCGSGFNRDAFRAELSQSIATEVAPDARVLMGAVSTAMLCTGNEQKHRD